MKMRLALHVETGPHGTVGVLDGIDQQAKAPLSGVCRDGTKVQHSSPGKLIQASFEGALSTRRARPSPAIGANPPWPSLLC